MTIKLFKKNLKNKQFVNYKKSSKKTLWISIFVFFVCATFIILSFFLEFEYGGKLKLLTISELSNTNSSRYTTRVWQPLGYLIAGVGVPICSCCLQVTTKNKLAEPTTLGMFPIILTSIFIGSFLNTNIYIQWLLSICFASIIIFTNLLISKSSISNSTFKSVLIGFTFNGIITGINWLIVTYLNTNSGLNPLSWITGTNLLPLTETNIIISGVVTLVFAICMLIMIPYYNIIQKDFLIAKSLGINVTLIYWLTAIFSIFIVISSSFVSGGVMLIGLAIPHVVRMLFRTNDNKLVMPMSALLGTSLLLFSNLLRNGFSLNINLLTAILSLFVFFNILKGKKWKQQ